MMTCIIKGVRQCFLPLLALVLLGIGPSELVAQSQVNNTNTEVAKKGKSGKQGSKTQSSAVDSVTEKVSGSLSSDSLQAKLSQALGEIENLKQQVEGMQSAITEKEQKTIPWYQSLWLVIAHVFVTIVIGFIAVLAKLGPKERKNGSVTDVDRVLQSQRQHDPTIEEKLRAEIDDLKQALKRQDKEVEKLTAELEELKSTLVTSSAQEPPMDTGHGGKPESTSQPISTQIEYVDDISQKDVPIEVRPQRSNKCYFKILDGQSLHLIDELTGDHISTLLQDGNLKAGLYRVEGEGSLLREKEAGRVYKSGNGYKLEKPLVLECYDN